VVDGVEQAGQGFHDAAALFEQAVVAGDAGGQLVAQLADDLGGGAGRLGGGEHQALDLGDGVAGLGLGAGAEAAGGFVEGPADLGLAGLGRVAGVQPVLLQRGGQGLQRRAHAGEALGVAGSQLGLQRGVGAVQRVELGRGARSNLSTKAARDSRVSRARASLVCSWRARAVVQVSATVVTALPKRVRRGCRAGFRPCRRGRVERAGLRGDVGQGLGGGGLQAGVGVVDGGEQLRAALLEAIDEGGEGLAGVAGEGVAGCLVAGEGGGPGVGDGGDGAAEAFGEAVELGFDLVGEACGACGFAR
jgi:hypothetical protein